VTSCSAALNEAMRSGLLPPERRVCMLLDVARSPARERNRRQEAVQVLLRAERSRRRAHANTSAHETIGSPLSAADVANLRALAHRPAVAT
jgi:hypothetical protein